MAGDSLLPSNAPQPAFQNVKVLFFDLMGTCLDWHSSIMDVPLAAHLLAPDPGAGAAPSRREDGLDARAQFALRWRQGFFDEIHARFHRGEEQEDIDLTHRRVLDRLVEGTGAASWSEAERQTAVNAWHGMGAWPDVAPALRQLRSKYGVFVLANGTTKLQLDLMRSSGLAFDMLFSSQLLGLTKPDWRVYQKAVDLVGGGQLAAEECVMVAAHAYDLRAAAAVGMKTVYVERWTEDGAEDMEVARGEFDVFIDRKDQGETSGLARVAALLGV